jgi:NADH:ubiquinone oxidoreductase subunit K
MPAILYCYSNMGRYNIHEYLTPSDSEGLNLMNIMPFHLEISVFQRHLYVCTSNKLFESKNQILMFWSIHIYINGSAISLLIKYLISNLINYDGYQILSLYICKTQNDVQPLID